MKIKKMGCIEVRDKLRCCLLESWTAKVDRLKMIKNEILVQ
jgi:hypothetical protein